MLPPNVGIELVETKLEDNPDSPIVLEGELPLFEFVADDGAVLFVIGYATELDGGADTAEGVPAEVREISVIKDAVDCPLLLIVGIVEIDEFIVGSRLVLTRDSVALMRTLVSRLGVEKGDIALVPELCVIVIFGVCPPDEDGVLDSFTLFVAVVELESG
ncbi:hypothetical protein F4861DRAFT_539764 [Xylaria intraflava]|nr:hypothetical protein F4861DRAFT_539764 [Xylaria intraflava]